MFLIVAHNAIGTYYSATRGFASIEEAKACAKRWHHTGIGDVIIAEADESEYRRINNRYSNEAIALMKF